jgi:hypothetical protein
VTGGQNSSCLGLLIPMREREEVEKGHRRVNMVQILYTHKCKWKKLSHETIPGMGVIKENGGGGEFKYIFDIL